MSRIGRYEHVENQNQPVVTQFFAMDQLKRVVLVNSETNMAVVLTMIFRYIICNSFGKNKRCALCSLDITQYSPDVALATEKWKLISVIMLAYFELSRIGRYILSEIWSYNVDYYHNILPGYTFYFELPKDTNVGGIGMYITNTFIHNEQVQYKIVPNNLVKIENIWIEETKNKTKYIIGGIYRHPNTSVLEFTKVLDSSLNQ